MYALDNASAVMRVILVVASLRLQCQNYNRVTLTCGQLIIQYGLQTFSYHRTNRYASEFIRTQKREIGGVIIICKDDVDIIFFMLEECLLLVIITTN